MIPILARDMLPRMALVALAGLLFYLLEPAFHQHEIAAEEMLVELPAELGPLGVAATLANLAALSMVILLGGFISNDRRRGYYRMYFSHPTSPLAFYGARWVVALVLAVLAATLFLVLGQFAAWGEFRGGAPGIYLAILSAIAYGGVVAFLSIALPRGDAWVAVVVFVFTLFWLYILELGAQPFTPAIRRALAFVLPPQTAMQDVYAGLLLGHAEWGAAAFVVGYGVFWLVAAALLVRVREWP
jgi:ABC-type multidrug transport system permease subunit